MGTVVAICYRSGGRPNLPTAIMVRFDCYSGPTLTDGTVPIIPIRRTWSASGAQYSRLQGLTLDKVVIDVGKEFSSGLTFVACSRVRRLTEPAV